MKKKIWIIDDYLPIVDCMRIVLELNHYEVEIAQNKLNTLNKTIKPDLLLIDYHIPGLDVDSILKGLKNNCELKSIPTILMSGDTDIEYLATLCGADDFIDKPINFDALLDKIEALCPIK